MRARARIACLAGAAMLALSACVGVGGGQPPIPFQFRVYPIPFADVYRNGQSLTPAYEVLVEDTIHGGTSLNMQVIKLRQSGIVNASYSGLTPAIGYSNTGFLSAGNLHSQVQNDITDIYPSGMYDFRLKVVSCRHRDGDPCSVTFAQVAEYPFVVQ
jgi:hypothetical protein